MSSPRVHTSRRTALTLALSAPLVLAACDLDPPTAEPSESPTVPPPPDAEVVASARQAILLTVALLEAVSARHRRLRADIRPLLRLHAAHLEVLDNGSEDGAEDEAVAPALPADTALMARTQVSDAESSLRSGPRRRGPSGRQRRPGPRPGQHVGGRDAARGHMSTLEALQVTLAAEHAAIFVYGDAGAHTSQSAEPALFDLVSTLYRTHRARRDRCGS